MAVSGLEDGIISLAPMIIVPLFIGIMLWKLLSEKAISQPNTLKFALIVLSAGLVMIAAFVPNAEKMQIGIVGLAGTILGYAFGKPVDSKSE